SLFSTPTGVFELAQKREDTHTQCTHSPSHTNTGKHTYARMQPQNVCKHLQLHTHSHSHSLSLSHTHTHTHTRTHTHTHTHPHTHTRSHTHTHTHTCLFAHKIHTQYTLTNTF